MSRLSKEEKEILEAFEEDRLVPAQNQAEILKEHREAAIEMLRKENKLSVRLSGKDLNALQVRALREGIPYQTLASSILHKYVEGQLVDATKVPAKQIRAAK